MLSIGAVPGSASPERDYARQVGYFSAPVGNVSEWHLACQADDPAVEGPLAIASAIEFSDGEMPGNILYSRRRSSSGQLIQVGDQQIAFEPRQATRRDEPNSFVASESSAGGPGGPARVHVAWALWSNTATCSAYVDGSPVAISYPSGAQAYFVGPEAFTGGVFVQNGSTHASAARIFSTDLMGGPLFVAMSVGQQGEGTLSSDYPNSLPVHDCREPNGNSCEKMAPRASKLVASLMYAAETSGGAQGELIVITLPPGA